MAATRQPSIANLKKKELKQSKVSTFLVYVSPGFHNCYNKYRAVFVKPDAQIN